MNGRTRLNPWKSDSKVDALNYFKIINSFENTLEVICAKEKLATICFFVTEVGYKGRWHFKKFSFHQVCKNQKLKLRQPEMLSAPCTWESSHTKWAESKALLRLVADTNTQEEQKAVFSKPWPRWSCFYKLAQIQGLGTPKYLSTLSLSYHCTGFADVLAVLPPFPITLPAAKDGTLIWASSFTSSLGLTKFSSLIFP